MSQPPSMIGPYAVVEELGRGAMGVVYLATAPNGQRVAVKVLLALDVDGVARFRREAELTARLRDPGILAPFDVGQHGGHHYYAMPYCTGEDLRQRMERELTVREAVRLVADMARTLQRAHTAGIVHRDLKPDNVLLEGGSPLLADFGLAKDVGDGTPLTATGTILGTPAYMAPEQLLDSKRVGPPADVYALGVILYECLTGQVPYTGSNVVAICQRALQGNPTDPREHAPTIPQELSAACLQALAVEPEERPSAAEFAKAIRAAVWAPRSAEAGRVALWVALALTAAGVAGALYASRNRPQLARSAPQAPTSGDSPRTDPVAPLLAEVQRLRHAQRPLPELRELIERARQVATTPAHERAIQDAWLTVLMARGQFAEAMSQTIGLAATPATRNARHLRAHALRWEHHEIEGASLLSDLAEEDPTDPICMLAKIYAGVWETKPYDLELVTAAYQAAPDNPYAEAAMVYAWLSQGRDALAKKELERLLAATPDHHALLWAAAEERVHVQDHRGAVAFLDRLIRLEEPTPAFGACLLRAVFKLKLGELEATVADCRRTLKIRPGYGPATLVHAVALWRLGRKEPATSSLRDFVLKSPTRFRKLLKKSFSSELTLELTQIAVEGFCFDPQAPLPASVERALERHAAELPEALHATGLQALRLAAGGATWPEIEPHCDPLRAEASGSVPASLLRVRLLYGRSQIAEALDELTETRALASSKAYATELDYWEASCVRGLSKFPLMRDILRKIRARDGESNFGQFANILLMLSHPEGELPGVRPLIEKLAHRAPHFTPGVTLNGLFQARRNHPWEALQALEAGINQQGLLDLDLALRRANVVAGLLVGVGLSELARAELDSVLTVGPSVSNLLSTVELFLSREDPSSLAWCTALADEALERAPQRGSAYRVRGKVALLRGEPAEAVLDYWLRARELSPSAPIGDAWLERLQEVHELDPADLEPLR